MPDSRFASVIVVLLSSTAAFAQEWPADALPAPKPAVLVEPKLITETAADESDEPVLPAVPAPGSEPGAVEPAPVGPVFDQALEGESAPSWLSSFPVSRVKFAPYGWLPEIYGQAGVRNVTANVALSTRDMLKLIEHDLNFMFAARMEAGEGPWTVMATGMYVNLGLGKDIRRFSFSSNFEWTLIDTDLLLELEGLADFIYLPSGSKIEAMVGTRYWRLAGDLSVTGPLGNTVSRGGSQEWVDPVIGGRLTIPVGTNTRIQIMGDYGGFGWWSASQNTWNFEAMLEKRYASGCFLAAGYRYLDVDYQHGSGRNRFAFDATVRGPVSMFGIDF